VVPPLAVTGCDTLTAIGVGVATGPTGTEFTEPPPQPPSNMAESTINNEG
jgi:hypothetical protein